MASSAIVNELAARIDRLIIARLALAHAPAPTCPRAASERTALANDAIAARNSLSSILYELLNR